MKLFAGISSTAGTSSLFSSQPFPSLMPVSLASLSSFGCLESLQPAGSSIIPLRF